MTGYPQPNGFSLTEVLLATGILAIGMAMIAMVFPVGVKLASLATERTIGTVAGEEALAKIKLYWVKTASDSSWTNVGGDPNGALEFHDVVNGSTLFDPAASTGERVYPSLVPPAQEQKYYWSALVWKTGTDSSDNVTELKARVFVCRVLAMGAKYYDMDASPNNNDNPWPVPVKVEVKNTATGNEIQVQANAQFAPAGTVYKFFTEGCMIVEDSTGRSYKVLEMKDKDMTAGRETLVLQILQDVFPTVNPSVYVWVVPPAVGSSRSPCIDVVLENSLHR